MEGETEESVDSLRLQCKYNGLCNYGTRGQLLMRLNKLKEWERVWWVICRFTEKQMNEMKQEQCVELDPELDGEPLSNSDYEGCF